MFLKSDIRYLHLETRETVLANDFFFLMLFWLFKLPEMILLEIQR